MLFITHGAHCALNKKLGLIASHITEDIELSVTDIKTNNKRFRIKVLGGGCSGFQYKFSIDDNISEDDKIFSSSKIQLEIVIDQHSLPLVLGSAIDYNTSLSGEYFFLKNPNSKSSCGCGNSFSV